MTVNCILNKNALKRDRMKSIRYDKCTKPQRVNCRLYYLIAAYYLFMDFNA